MDGFHHPRVIVRPDWIAHLTQGSRISRSECEQIGDSQPAAFPSAGQADTPPNRRIVVNCIGSRRIQHDEGRGSIPETKLTGQQVAVLAAR
jgi:hypothetical protein